MPHGGGIRRAEMCHLRIDDIQVERQCLMVRLGKGQKNRYVPIGTRALLWIARYAESARDQLLLDEKETTLFLTADGQPIHPDALTEYARRYIRAAGIDKPGACHIFRHTMATLMHDAGADLSLIQLILGHEKTETTQIYAKTSLKRLLEVHSKTHPAEQEKPNESSQHAAVDSLTTTPCTYGLRRTDTTSKPAFARGRIAVGACKRRQTTFHPLDADSNATAKAKVASGWGLAPEIRSGLWGASGVCTNS